MAHERRTETAGDSVKLTEEQRADLESMADWLEEYKLPEWNTDDDEYGWFLRNIQIMRAVLNDSEVTA